MGRQTVDWGVPGCECVCGHESCVGVKVKVYIYIYIYHISYII